MRSDVLYQATTDAVLFIVACTLDINKYLSKIVEN